MKGNPNSKRLPYWSIVNDVIRGIKYPARSFLTCAEFGKSSAREISRAEKLTKKLLYGAYRAGAFFKHLLHARYGATTLVTMFLRGRHRAGGV